jgi:hypothetical protein
MNLAEAESWLRGERSAVNDHYNQTADRNYAFARAAEEDAARTQQAYWIVRAHAEKLVKETPDAHD